MVILRNRIIAIQRWWRNNDINSELINVIEKNSYVKKCKTNKHRDKNSMSYLLNENIKPSQSNLIKLGIGLEKVLLEFIIKNNKNLTNIKCKNVKGVKEMDHLFKDEKNKIIYYAELKSNLNLDTEKSKSTYKKCLFCEEKLKEKYKEYEIKMFLVGCRYYKTEEISRNIMIKYKPIVTNVVGINQYFKNLNILYKFNSENQYKVFINNLYEKMFQ